MKLKNFITLLLLFAISFSTTHKYFYTLVSDNKCSVIEYVHEQDIPSDHGQLCDIHFEFHNPFILPQDNMRYEKISLNFDPFVLDNNYFFKINLDIYKPPIA